MTARLLIIINVIPAEISCNKINLAVMGDPGFHRKLLCCHEDIRGFTEQHTLSKKAILFMRLTDITIFLSQCELFLRSFIYLYVLFILHVM